LTPSSSFLSSEARAPLSSFLLKRKLSSKISKSKRSCEEDQEICIFSFLLFKMKIVILLSSSPFFALKALCASFLLQGTCHACEELIETPQAILQELLPPVLPFNDSKSVHEFVVSANDPFITPAEASNFTETANYTQVMDFFTKLADESPYVQVQTLTTLANGEDLVMVTVSGQEQFEPNSMTTSSLPIVYMTAGIHPGESMGVNAGMMFLRNLVSQEANKDILNKVNFLFVPIMNIQGYLRQSPNGRINQHGPNTSGRRANAHWHNLNRDFGKLDTPEVRAIVKVMNDYDISFYADLHSTDGMMYQADVEFCDNGAAGLSPNIYQWLRAEMQPPLVELLESYNHKTSVCVDANDPMDPTAGYYPYYSDGAAFSNNYADHRQIPAYLLEIHAPKPFKQRVLGAYAFIYGVTKVVSEKADTLREAIEADRAARIDPVPIAWDYDDPAPIVDFDVYNWSIVMNPVLGIEQIIYTDEPITIQVEQSDRSTPANPPTRPYAYVIPAVWSEVIERLAIHGIEMEIFTEEMTLDVMNYRIDDFESSGNREGRATASGTPVPENCTRTYKKNDVFIRTDQSLGTLTVALLEPTGESSFFYWGFFNAKFVSHEYPENYIMVPLAERMLNQSLMLREEWEQYKALMGNDTSGVLDWFFRRSAFYDSEAYVLDIGILYEAPASGTLDNLEPYTDGMASGGDFPSEVTTSNAASFAVTGSFAFLTEVSVLWLCWLSFVLL
jgi:murein tripeptide amidase MpaA